MNKKLFAARMLIDITDDSFYVAYYLVCDRVSLMASNNAENVFNYVQMTKNVHVLAAFRTEKGISMNKMAPV